MGWINFVLCIGMRIDLDDTSLESLDDLLSILNDIRADTSSLRSATINDLSVSSLKTTFKGTESCEENYEKYDEDAFGDIRSRNNCFMLFFKVIQLDSSNGHEMDTNMVYSSGHLEYHHGEVKGSLDPTAAEKDLFQEIARRAGIPFKLSFSLRARGCNADTQVWP